MYDVARIDERFGLRPDQMIDYKALKGDPTDNIPGVPGVGEKTAAKLIREFGDLDSLLARLDEVTPAKLARQAARARRPDPDGPRAVDDRPRPADRVRPRAPRASATTTATPSSGCSASTSSGRSSSACRRWPARPPSSGPRGCDRSPRAATCPRRASPAGRRAGARPDDGRAATRRQRRAPAPARLRRRVGGRDRRPGATDGTDGGDAGAERPLRAGPPTCRPRWPRRSSTPAGSRSAAPTASPTSSPGWRPSRRSASRSSLDDPRPRRGTPLALAVAGHGRPGRGRRRAPRPPMRCGASSNGSARRSSATRSSRSSSRRSPTTRNATHRRRSRSTPRSRPTSSTPRCAARRSPTSSPRTSTRSCRRRPSCRPRPGPGSRRCRRSRSASRSSDGSSRSTLERLFREVELPLIPVLARMEAVGVALDLEALGVLDREFARRDLPARGRDLRRRRPRVQPRQPQAARAGPVLRARPAQGQADEDRLLDRRLGARGPAPGPPDDRQAPRVAGLHEAALDLRRGAADADRRPTAGCTRRSTRPSRRPAGCRRPTRTSRTSRSGPSSGGGSGGRSWPATRRSSCSPPTTRRSSCGSSPTCRATSTSRTPSRGGADIHRETAARVLHKDPADITQDERSMAKMVNFGLAYGMSDFGLASRANIPRRRGAGVHQLVLRGLLGDQLLHDGDQGAGQGAGLGRDAARPQAPDPGAPRIEPGPARRGRADGHQHADPGHGRGHPEDRDDPRRRAARGGRARAPGSCCRSTTSCCSRSRATRSSRWPRSCARRWRAPCR